MGEQEESKETYTEKDDIVLRSFPKGIFFTPLFAISIIFG